MSAKTVRVRKRHFTGAATPTAVIEAAAKARFGWPHCVCFTTFLLYENQSGERGGHLLDNTACSFIADPTAFLAALPGTVVARPFQFSLCPWVC